MSALTILLLVICKHDTWMYGARYFALGFVSVIIDLFVSWSGNKSSGGKIVAHGSPKCYGVTLWHLISMHLCPRQLLWFCRRLGAFAMHISMVLLLMFSSPPRRGAGPMALMLGHEWQYIYLYILYILRHLMVFWHTWTMIRQQQYCQGTTKAT
jgi:hypothetical protein